MKDTRIAYGAACTWWDSIDKVGSRQGIPCCPHCRGVLFEVPDEAKWNEGVARYEEDGHPGYSAMVRFARGKCFKNYSALEAAFKAKGLQ